MNTDMFIAGAAGFAPAVVLMYYTLKDYTYPAVEKPFFDDRKAFGIFAIGLVIGTIIYAIQSWFPLGLLLIALVFAVLEELIKLVILNLPRFQGKLDTPFYGITLGLGIGATMGFGAFYLTIGQLGDLTAFSWVVLIVIAIQFVLLHGATGGMIGMGVARKMPWPYFAQATLIHLAYNLLMIPFFTADELLGYPLFAVATVMLVFFYYQLWRMALPELINKQISKLEKRAKD
ncbi:MAG: hypothetical protein GKC03_06905 [Methanomassiliicoccales archaeon]|jgi:hypothetical protein|nr:hypothetical protein [Methanomassiliicoccales archaeon]NYT14741.1 hypothetical protein [Methanomassiliicoccales archaeon]